MIDWKNIFCEEVAWLRALALGAAACLALALSGCVSTSLEDAAPTAADVAAPQDLTTEQGPSESASASTGSANLPIVSIVPPENEVEPADFVAEGASRTGKAPSLVRRQPSAAAQFSDADIAELQAEMDALSAGASRSGTSRAEYLRKLRLLEELRRSHGRETLAEIEE